MNPLNSSSFRCINAEIKWFSILYTKQLNIAIFQSANKLIPRSFVIIGRMYWDVSKYSGLAQQFIIMSLRIGRNFPRCNFSSLAVVNTFHQARIHLRITTCMCSRTHLASSMDHIPSHMWCVRSPQSQPAPQPAPHP
jgi:hypothetical protein